MVRFVTLPEVERLTGIKANTLRVRMWRGMATPFPIYKIDGLGYAVKEHELHAFIASQKPVTPSESPSAA